ncbi:MAG TPA: hypothetical protein VHJ20_02640 [Polyangia bacterium]|nr:hypothetical protein [Polyangia bacterium]
MPTNTGADVMMMWSKAQVIVEGLGSLGIVATLFYSVWSFRTTIRDASYAELDRVYFDILKLGLERPDLLSFGVSPTSDDPAKAREYGAYAFMVWNFVETVFDRCEAWSRRRLRETWYPVIAAENALHRAWFDEPANRIKFKPRFVRFVETQYPRGSRPAPP